MKVLLINGSPNKNGCTNRALMEISTTLQKCSVDTEIIWLGAKPIAGCIACGFCRKAKRCVFEDIVNKISSKIDEADGLIFGSPVYYAGISGQLKSFLDRLFYSRGSSSFKGKVGAAVVSCRRGGATTTFDDINRYFTISNMPIVSSQYWNQVHGNTVEEVEKDLEGLQTMRTLGRNMAWLIKCIHAGKEQGIDFDFPEEKINTNFIR